MKRQTLSVLAVLLLSACGDASPPADAPNDAPRAASAAPDTRAAPAGDADRGSIVIRVAPGGAKPEQFCMPKWSIENHSGQDIGALLVHLEWRTRDGQVLEAARELGTMVEPFNAGRIKDLSLNGYTADCRALRLVVGTYACRNADAVRMPCPGPLRARAEGGMQVELGGAAEGSMRGAVEPQT